MVLLDMVVGEGIFCFRAKVNQTRGGVRLGLIDRMAQKEQNRAQNSCSIMYGSDGVISYATDNGSEFL
jgi:hypothetical protein